MRKNFVEHIKNNCSDKNDTYGGITIKHISQENQNWIDLIQKIREYFGDKNLYFTFSPFKGNRICNEYQSTFADDNIETLKYWCLLMDAKLQRKTIDAISLVTRVILSQKITFYKKENEYPFLRKSYIILLSHLKNLLFLMNKKQTNVKILMQLQVDH